MEPTSERARQGYAEHRRQLELGDDALADILARVETSVAEGKAEGAAAAIGMHGRGSGSSRLSGENGGKRVTRVAAMALAAAAAISLVWWGYTSGSVSQVTSETEATDASAAAFVRRGGVDGFERAQTRTRRRSDASRSVPMVNLGHAAAAHEESDAPDPAQAVAPREAKVPREPSRPELDPGGGSSDLRAEISLIRRARAALHRADVAEARAALSEHRRAFPKGQLAADRNALWEETEASTK